MNKKHLITPRFPDRPYSVITTLLFFGIFILSFLSSFADFNCIFVAFTVSMQLKILLNIKKVNTTNGLIFYL